MLAVFICVQVVLVCMEVIFFYIQQELVYVQSACCQMLVLAFLLLVLIYRQSGSWHVSAAFLKMKLMTCKGACLHVRAAYSYANGTFYR